MAKVPSHAFASDNAAPVHPKVIDAIVAANNDAVASYGNDPTTPRAADAIKAVFDSPDAEVLFALTGTATCTAVVTRWDFWGSGYRVDFTVTTPSATPFEWEVALDLSATGQAAPGGGTLFPGYPVPAAQWWSSWTPTHFSGSNVCADSRAGELPVVRLRGSSGWSSEVSASTPVQSLGFQANQNGSGTINSLGCK